MIFLITGCHKKYVQDNPATSVTYFQKDGVSKAMKKEDVSSLKLGTSRKDIENKYGKPFKDVGSGLYIYQYNINNATSILLYFDQYEKLYKIVSIDSNNVKKTLLE